MSAGLLEAVEVRQRRAAQRANEIAAQLEDGDERNVGRQAELEEALTDLRHYAEVVSALRPIGDQLKVYRRRGQHSFLRDLYRHVEGSDRAATERLGAHRRTEAAAGFDLLDTRALGEGTVASQIPTWSFTEIPTSTISAPFLTRFARPLRPGSGLHLTELALSTPPVGGAQPGLGGSIPDAGSVADLDVSAPVRTFASTLLVGQQHLDHGPPESVDEALLPALVGAANAAAELSIFGGDGTDGELTGFANLADTSTASFTTGSPTVALFLAALEPLIRTTQAAAGTGARPIICLHPRRLSWLRQRSVAEGLAVVGASRDPARFDASILETVDVVSTPGIPTDLGTGDNEDLVVVVADLAALSLSAGAPSVLVKIGNAQLQVRLTAVRYVALTSRLPAAVGVLGGTGLVAPV
jgi:hypothetical protein